MGQVPLWGSTVRLFPFEEGCRSRTDRQSPELPSRALHPPSGLRPAASLLWADSSGQLFPAVQTNGNTYS